MTTHTVQFEDHSAFYSDLKRRLESGQAVEVKTDFTRYEQLPSKFKELFELDKHRSEAWASRHAFVAHAIMPASLNFGVLAIFAAAASGAAVGSLFGPVGTVVGALTGLIVGSVSVAVSSNDSNVEIVIDARGRLTIRIRPR